MAKTNVKRKESKETVEDEVESNESVVSGGAKVDFTDNNITKDKFNKAVIEFNKQVNGETNSLKNAIDAYNTFIADKTNETKKTAAIAAIKEAVTNSGVTLHNELKDTETKPETIYVALKTVYDGYQAIYTAAKTNYNTLNTQNT